MISIAPGNLTVDPPRRSRALGAPRWAMPLGIAGQVPFSASVGMSRAARIAG